MRGEASITLTDGSTATIRIDPVALLEVEHDTGISILDHVRRSKDLRLTYELVVAIVAAGLQRDPRFTGVPTEEISALMRVEDFASYAEAVTKAILGFERSLCFLFRVVSNASKSIEDSGGSR